MHSVLLFAALLLAPRDFVQQFYSWYTPRVLHDTTETGVDLVLREKPVLLDAKLRRALQEDADAQKKAKGDIVGLDWDPFLASQDACERYVVGAVTATKSGYLVEVHSICEGKKSKHPDVIAEIEQRDGKWVFINFRYPDTPDLLSALATLREDRRKGR